MELVHSTNFFHMDVSGSLFLHNNDAFILYIRAITSSDSPI